jgi:hypothetical protein
MIEASHHILLEHINDYLLPKSKENGDFNRKKLKQS